MSANEFALLYLQHEERLYREDYHFALIACFIYNANRDPEKTKAAAIEDFMLSPPEKPEKRDKTPEEIRALFESRI